MQMNNKRFGFFKNKKRASWTLSDMLFWFFYIPLTLVVISLLFVVPNSILKVKTSTAFLENEIILSRALNSIYYSDPITDKIYSNTLNPNIDLNIFNLSEQSRKFAFKISIDDSKFYYFNQKFFDISRPLAPIRYGLQTRTLFLKDLKGSIHKVDIEQTFTK